MNKRQKAKHARQQATLREVRETVNMIVEAKHEIERSKHEINRFINQQRVTLECYRDLLKDVYRWQDWRKERPTKTGLYIVYTLQGTYGLITADEKYKGIYLDQHSKQSVNVSSIRYWRPLIEVANWQKIECEKEYQRRESKKC